MPPVDLLPSALERARAALEAGDIPVALTAVQPLLSGDDGAPWVLASVCAERLGDLEALSHLLAGALQRQQGLEPAVQTQLADMTRRVAAYGGQAPGAGSAIDALVSRLPFHGPATPLDPQQTRAFAANLARLGNLDALDALTSRRAEALLPGLPALTEQAVTEVLGHWPLADEPDFVFVGGCPRSGTTLVRAMLDAHATISAGPELKLVRELGRARQRWQQSLGPALAEAGVDNDRLDRACRAFLQVLLTDLGPGRIVEKTPGNLLHLTWLARLFPRGRFVHVIRDGRAVATSLMKVNWTDPRTGRSVWYCESLENAARYWAMVIDEVQRQSEQVPKRVFEVHYEALVADPQPVLEKLLAFLGEPWDPMVLAHHRADVNLPRSETSSAAVSRPVNRHASQAWRSILDADQVRTIEREAGLTLSRLGYEPT